ncbi:TPA: class I SAM-dependent methyltransferase [Candidatus Poribacteria bacterium]|nr:class I SAM-dependent methyltransferase [Candidatus Poribacteria bacterium]HEX30946.1 class I SAM-dependent methyltransferase [Candidatus Poribacteria bacterium]
MKKMKVKVKIPSIEEESWNIVWKWSWFTRELWESEYWNETRKGLKPLFSLLTLLKVKSVLDCSCGLGFKTVLIAEKGYEVEGSDGSAIAVRYAPQLAKERGVNIRFFHSRWEELGLKCGRTYDCVFSDYFDEIETYETLKASAAGIYSVLNYDGKFIFGSLNPELTTRSGLKNLIEREWENRERFVILPPYEKDGMRVTSIEVAEKTAEGILEKRIYLIEKQGIMRAEIAFIMNPRIKWTFQDYVKILKEVGFKKVECIGKGGDIFNIATK